MADEQEVITTPEQPKASETPAAIDPVEFKRLQDALHAANKEAADRRKKLDALEKAEADRQAAAMTESEKAAAKLKEYEMKLANMERAALLRKVADEVGLPASLAERLQGGSEDELKADAQKLLEMLPAAKPKPTAATTNPGMANRAETQAEKKTRLLGGPANIWSGGGIQWPNEPQGQ